MILKKTISVITATVLFSTACRPSDENKSYVNPKYVSETTSSADEYFNWSADKLQQTLKMANRGDVKSARSVYSYYRIRNLKIEYEYWENWLIKHHDPEALEIKASRIFTISVKMEDTNPAKKSQLKDARDLVIRANLESKGKIPRDGQLLLRIDQEISRMNK